MTARMQVDLFWFATGIGAAQSARAGELLAADERARAARLLAASHRHRFIAARAGLRCLLGAKLQRPPSAIEFAYAAGGKPHLADSRWRFNLSHSGDYALVALSADGEVGVDLERERPRLDALGIARRFFTPRERAWLEAAPAPARARAFVRLWSCKEAWLKLTGKGLALPLDEVEVTLAPGARVEAGGRGWPVSELPLAADYGAALVTAAPHAPPAPQWLEIGALLDAAE